MNTLDSGAQQSDVVNNITVREAKPEDKPEWLRMRLLLWNSDTAEYLSQDMDELLANPLASVFVVPRPAGGLGAFLEVSIRESAPGCQTSPVGYVEGIHVDEDLRRHGIAKALMKAGERWVRSQGLSEIAADTWLDDEISIQMQARLGYEEAARLVHFVKTVARSEAM